jgi:hypothetical protein
MKIKLILLFIVGAFVGGCVSKWQAKAEAALAAGIIYACMAVFATTRIRKTEETK